MPEPIEIVIRKTSESATQQRVTDTNYETSIKKSLTSGAVNTALVNAGKQLAMYGVSQFGNLTGNTIAQRKINDALKISGYATQVAVGGWIGAVAVGVQLTTDVISNSIDVAKANLNAQLLYERSGNITIDGGRGTNG